MSGTNNHPWCSDVSRDKAIRAAEDAAAAERLPLPDHRELPAAVAELRERVAMLEAGQATIGSGDVFRDVGCGSTGDEIIRLTAERDAAKEECERLRESARGEIMDNVRLRQQTHELRARVAELENAAAPAANAGWDAKQSSAGGAACGASGEAEAPATPSRSCEAAVTDGRPAATAEPVAWGVMTHDGRFVCAASKSFMESEAKQQRGTLHPLYAAPQPPRGWLTEEEREAVKAAVIFSDQHGRTNLGVALDALLARSTPPRVKVPVVKLGGFPKDRDDAWIAAIREAGGEVE